jgi:hypothetical protein
MTAKAGLTGKRTFSVDEVVSEPALRSIYDELRQQHSALVDSDDEREEVDSEIENNDAPEISGWWSRDYPVQLVMDFEEQVADDLSLLETDVLDSCAASGEIMFGG